MGPIKRFHTLFCPMMFNTRSLRGSLDELYGTFVQVAFT